MSLPEREAAAVSAAVAVMAAAAVLGGAPAAYATVVDVTYDCGTPIGDAEEKGGAHDLVVHFGEAAMAARPTYPPTPSNPR
ncbi:MULTISPECIES: hypothetical protein [unclassified Streptomyces]|uniref:hypothetical protein n=1 Tax=unclassified Streptomyces TaxID=2593676 RepID=UPI00036468CF|nr:MULTISPECIES: hypothetical protein [unclassified Streptomyces]MYX37307.1 hypothetical protein [Streptomyces sp. SID8377]